MHIKGGSSNWKGKGEKYRNGGEFDFILYYAVPEGMVSLEEIPDYAGLIYVNGAYANIIKRAPYMHKRRQDITKILLKKYYNLWEYEAKKIKSENEYLKNLLNKKIV